jgi:hypothetical protein
MFSKSTKTHEKECRCIVEEVWASLHVNTKTRHQPSEHKDVDDSNIIRLLKQSYHL